MSAWNSQAYFDAPSGNEPLALDMRSMGKGQVWINGESLGRYWMAYAKGDCNTCSYSGTYRPTNCLRRCGRPTQRWYFPIMTNNALKSFRLIAYYAIYIYFTLRLIKVWILQVSCSKVLSEANKKFVGSF